jgi:hypothetical protein
MTDMRNTGFEDARIAGSTEFSGDDDNATFENAREPIGLVLEIGGAGSQLALDLQRLNECNSDGDPSIALAGQVTSQIKIRAGTGWLLASVRNQKTWSFGLSSVGARRVARFTLKRMRNRSGAACKSAG